MTHCFDATAMALEQYKEDGYPINDFNLETIHFALRFTKAALSGEVSDVVENKGCDEFLATWPWLRTEIDTGAYGVMPPEPLSAAFKAMCAELAKEVGNG